MSEILKAIKKVAEFLEIEDTSERAYQERNSGKGYSSESNMVFFSREKAEGFKRLMRGEKEKDERRYVRV